MFNPTWWFIPRIVSGLVHPNYKWTLPPLIPFITRVTTHFLSGMNHQVSPPGPLNLVSALFGQVHQIRQVRDPTTGHVRGFEVFVRPERFGNAGNSPWLVFRGCSFITRNVSWFPSGKPRKTMEKNHHIFNGKSTRNMAIFDSY